MSAMTTHERMTRTFEHREADRIPIFETPWGATRERWQEEGLQGSYVDFFGLDHLTQFGIDISPRYPTDVIEETDEYKVFKTVWGATMKDWKHRASVPEVIDVTIKTADDWAEAKARMTPTEDRIDWDRLRKNYKHWREAGHWLMFGGWFGFDVTHARMTGTERCLMALVEDPEWIVDIWEHQLHMCLTLFNRIWDEGYHFDAIKWPDDMGYKHSQFFSLRTYREHLKPIHQQAIDWAHEKGMKAMLHSCGDISPFIDELVGMGLDYLNPLEVKAGLDPVWVKQTYGDDLVLHGGINALTWADVDQMEQTVRELVPKMKEGGGYIFATDHSTPSNVGLQDFKRIVDVVKEVGAYD